MFPDTSLLISVPPKSIVLPLRNISLNLLVVLPKSYVTSVVGIILPATVSAPPRVTSFGNPTVNVPAFTLTSISFAVPSTTTHLQSGHQHTS